MKQFFEIPEGSSSEQVKKILAEASIKFSAVLEKVKEAVETFNSLTEDEVNDYVKYNSIAKAWEEFSPVAEKLVYARSLQAFESTEEFDYGLYKDALIIALRAQISKLFILDTRAKTVDITFEPLGDISMWADAVNQVRADHNWGVKTKGKKIGGEDFSSRIWREKIYSVDRRGGSVTKQVRRYNKTTKQYEFVTKDVTERYEGKYADTIVERLNYIPHDKAPFWNIVDKGNSVMIGHGGEEFPKTRGTNFVNDLRLELKVLFSELLNKYEDVVEKEFVETTKQYMKEAGFPVPTTLKYKDLVLNLNTGETIETWINSFNNLDVMAGATRTFLGKVKIGNKNVEAYLESSGRITSSIRNAKGQFAPATIK